MIDTLRFGVAYENLFNNDILLTLVEYWCYYVLFSAPANVLAVIKDIYFRKGVF